VCRTHIVGTVRLSAVILPIHRWNEGQKIWRRAEHLGFHTAYTHAHLSWRGFPRRAVVRGDADGGRDGERADAAGHAGDVGQASFTHHRLTRGDAIRGR
jgi:hypothetical protein